MLRALLLLAPALFPSWRFFQAVEPSPRLLAAFLRRPDDPPEWTPVRPPPARVGPWAMLARLFWNPHRNQTLFLISCAERIIEDGRPHALRAIAERVRADAPHADGLWLRLRIETVWRDGATLARETVFDAPPDPPLDPPRR